LFKKCDFSSSTQTQNDEEVKSKKPRKRIKKFGDMSEDDVMKLLLPDRVAENLDILFVSRFCIFLLVLNNGCPYSLENVFFNSLFMKACTYG